MDKGERLDRALEAAVALLEGAPSKRLQVTNLNKGLFYLDLVALRDTGDTLTGAPYVALKQGPVLDQYKVDLIPSLMAAGFARQDDQGMEKPVVLLKPCESYHYMDDYLRSMAAAIARHVASKTAASISEFSHQNPGWIAAFEDGQGINVSPRRINMMLAMQQILDRDPWLDEPADEDVLRAFAESRSPKSEREV
jgi:uncharacterized phage-associated protein